MARSKQRQRLSRFVQYHNLPPIGETDWVEIYKFWLEYHKDPNTLPKRRPSTEQERMMQRVRSMNCRARACGDDVNRITLQDLVDVAKKYGNKCAKCGTTGHLVYDHKIAYFNGGKNTKDNLQLLCRLCNMVKGVS